MYLRTHWRDLSLHTSRFLIARFLVALMMVASGCGPFGFIKKVSQPVNRSLAQAKVAGAEELAAYEYWSAIAYFEQARELMGYSEYERALDYGTRAKQLADEAKLKAERVRTGRSIESIASETSEISDAPRSTDPNGQVIEVQDSTPGETNDDEMSQSTVEQSPELGSEQERQATSTTSPERSDAFLILGGERR